LLFARFARKRRRSGSFFGLRPKNEPHSPLFCERSEQKKAKAEIAGIFLPFFEALLFVFSYE
jgi:hypothetical protein